MTVASRARPASLFVLAPLAAGLLAWLAPGAAAGAGSATARPGRALIFVVDGVPLPEAIAVPEFRQLARAGGLGLMTTRVPPGTADRRQSSHLTIGAGTGLAETASPEATLMAKALAVAGVQTCSSPAGSVLSDIGDGACTTGTPSPATVRVIRLREPSGSPAERRSILRADGRIVRTQVEGLGNARSLVMIVVPTPSAAMDARGDEVTPLIEAKGPASTLLAPNGRIHALTSPSTRQDGLVANTDVAPTVVAFFGVEIPAEMDGSPIRATGAQAPIGLYERQLAYRHLRFPVQIFELVVIALAGLAAVRALLWLDPRRRLSPARAGVWRFLALMGAAFPLAILSGGLLPFTPWVVYAYLILMPVAVAALAMGVRWPGPYPAFGFLGAVGLGFIVLDLLTGAHAMRIPLEGGVMFDGARFFGLPNFAISPLLASALFVAVGLSTGWGTALLAATGLVAGWPSLGADVGGAITLFVAAGLWFAVRRAGGRLRPSGVAIAAGFAAAGLAAVLLANRFLPGIPTHATRFVERATGGFASLFSTVVDRFEVGVRLVVRIPIVLIPLIGIVVVLVLVVRRPGVLRAGLADRRWRNMIGVLTGAALVSYFVNDTGSTATAPAFLYAMVALFDPTVAAFTADAPVPSRAARAGSRDAPGAASPARAGTAPRRRRRSSRRARR